MLMRVLRILNLAILSTLLAGSAFVFAQDDKPQDDKPARQEEPKPQPKQDETKPQPKPDEAKPTKQDKDQEKQDQKRDQDQMKQDQMKPQGQEHPEQQMDHARPQAQERPDQQRTEPGRPTGKSQRIPDDKFRAHFGRSHTFSAKTVIVSGQPQFQYGGYSFQLVDAWPGDWAYTDECYIDYIDGEYFLFDLLHPGVRVAVFVVM
jgi:hypothetical protein